MHRCYCGSTGLRDVTRQQQQLHVRPQHPRGDLMSVTSSSRQSQRATQFVKRPSLKTAPRLGLGHSSTELGNDFSRRNSAATTVSHCSSCSCSSSTQQRQQSRAKVLRWGWERTGGVDTNTNTRGRITTANNYALFTDNRRLYEQSACVASRQMSQGQGQVHSGNSSPSPRLVQYPTKQSTDELQQLQALQQFRLMNMNDCFSDSRQNELRLQQAYDQLNATNMDKWNKNRANESRQQEGSSSSSSNTTTPYALRQKLLQLRLQAEEKCGRGTGAMCAPLEKSCALRYN
ncbi:uncharacterized protein LOC110185371 [Drosophila serrata]|uniref:uncharacterized protein LOC110185371 n=1 Tax=Drosophila serrata TaxID=7274 RepID=UPI000A1CFD94|nr:uncharacterized protein LOC110185371 [Drosophila serrata]KAH8385936.1 hypothetical protein KR200_007172 [Drosophila serrata]